MASCRVRERLTALACEADNDAGVMLLAVRAELAAGLVLGKG